MEKVTDVQKAQTSRFVLITPDKLRDIANELERCQKMQAIKGENAFVKLTDSIILAFDTTTQ